MDKKVNFKNKNHIHFTGIKGVGQTALALCAKDLGIKITGSDVGEYFVTDETLAKANIKWLKGFDRQNISDSVDLVVTTGAHGGFSNPEVVEAKKRGIKVAAYAEAMSDLANEKDVITVVGVGGKTTTCSILAVLFEKSNLDPSYLVGVGEINPIGRPGKFSKNGRHFICEGDDYVVDPEFDKRAKFLLLDPKIVVVTNIEHDHPDIYPTLAGAAKVFKKLFNKIPDNGLLVAHIDNENVKNAIRNLKVPIMTYGFSKNADWIVSDVVFGDGKTRFRLKHGNITYDLSITVPGEYNVLNAVAAFIVGKHEGISDSNLKKGLALYLGCRRRFEKIGDYKGALIYDDYAHHPEEIKAVLKAAHEWFPRRRIFALFQPHTHTRTKALFKDFSRAFSDADMVGFMDIYSSAREKKDRAVSSEKLAKETKKYHKKVYYTKGQKESLKWIKENVKKGDVLLTIGAGDIFHLHEELLGRLY